MLEFEKISMWIQVLVKDSVPGDSIIWRLKMRKKGSVQGDSTIWRLKNDEEPEKETPPKKNT